MHTSTTSSLKAQPSLQLSTLSYIDVKTSTNILDKAKHIYRICSGRVQVWKFAVFDSLMCRVARGLGNGAIVEVVDGVEKLVVCWCHTVIWVEGVLNCCENKIVVCVKLF